MLQCVVPLHLVEQCPWSAAPFSLSAGLSLAGAFLPLTLAALWCLYLEKYNPVKEQIGLSDQLNKNTFVEISAKEVKSRYGSC